jgi:hypothetical protein
VAQFLTGPEPSSGAAKLIHDEGSPMPINLATQPALDSIQERDLDLLLMIALNGSETFGNAFIHRITGKTPTGFEKAWRGLADHNGETDVTVVYTDSDGSRAAILIENKIDAPFQKDQAKRCWERGELGVNNGDWTRFKTCLCAPKSIRVAVRRRSRLGPRCRSSRCLGVLEELQPARPRGVPGSSDFQAR